MTNAGSDDYFIRTIDSSDSSTCSNLETTAYSHQEDAGNNLEKTFKILGKLAFLPGDVVAEKEADEFFSRIHVCINRDRALFPQKKQGFVRNGSMPFISDFRLIFPFQPCYT
jgi:hypothetical protein